MTWAGTVERRPGDVPGMFCAPSLLYISRMSIYTLHFLCIFVCFLIFSFTVRALSKLVKNI